MTGNLLRNWFVPKDGISREVISADIQRFLGNDATVRPGKDVINGKEIEGYWIRAYRNLTTEMINDLKVATQKWDREQRSGRRGSSLVRASPTLSISDTPLVTNYEDSHTYRSSNHAGYGVPASSPHLDGPFQPPPVSRSSQIPPADMSPYPDPRSMYPTHSLPPQTSAFVEPPMYASHPTRQTSQAYPSQQDYYPTNPPYGHEPQRSSPQYSGPQYGNGSYGAPPPRDPRDDPRYQPDYQDPSVSYPPQIRYDQYGRPFSQSIPDPPYRASAPVESPHYPPRDRPSGQQGGDSRRRRI